MGMLFSCCNFPVNQKSFHNGKLKMTRIAYTVMTIFMKKSLFSLGIWDSSFLVPPFLDYSSQFPLVSGLWYPLKGSGYSAFSFVLLFSPYPRITHIHTHNPRRASSELSTECSPASRIPDPFECRSDGLPPSSSTLVAPSGSSSSGLASDLTIISVAPGSNLSSANGKWLSHLNHFPILSSPPTPTVTSLSSLSRIMQLPSNWFFCLWSPSSVLA